MTQETIDKLQELLDQKNQAMWERNATKKALDNFDDIHKPWVQVDNFFDEMRKNRGTEYFKDFAEEILPVIREAWQRQCDKKEKILNDIQKQIDEL